ncbi:5-formyltetrahydrofolate cyclo-ligase [Porphyromonadaceae bacterium OttesenSCG-928-L07]|nr:5-formyltetrahydrofolate cyclo-ligase [Porphyromonadaceae bacterium OttesenSCG-928-L07]MDL2252083.1 5-formyltetrahydrofolate cyclo-ligase [Odoribacter sp. OttesenSCG-928-J03]MDL2330830.1 5-formyltetrahydrofolate cyclo-ligase [Odoribacter sp. OttesenSCG-928-A06]
MKKAIRKQIRELKKQYTETDLRKVSEDIMQRIEQEEAFKNANVIGLYWSLNDEVYTHDFVQKWASEKRILLPCIVGEDVIEFRGFKCKDDLCLGVDYSIPEPEEGEAVNPKEIELMIVPGVAFDPSGNRLGRGKGFYDRFLKKTQATKLGVCFPFQLLESVPADELDIRMDKVITK